MTREPIEIGKEFGCGLARHARNISWRAAGKVEIVGVDEQYIYLRYHQAKDLADRGRIMVFHRDDRAVWLDDLEPADAKVAPSLAATSLFDIDPGPE